MNGIVTRGFVKGLVIRGFGEYEVEEVGYYVVAVCEPTMTSYAHGKRHVRAKELKPTMRTSTPLYYYEEIEE